MAENNTHISAARSAWTFDGIADRFETHIERSVPHYSAGHELICRFGDFFLRDDSLVYELGTSTGRLARAFLEWNARRENMRYVGIDTSADMIEHARGRSGGDPRASFVVADATVEELERCTLVLSYYTMQFIHPARRQQLFDHIYDALEWGGALIMFEKVRGPDARFQDYMSQYYQEFKLENGFTPDDILNKSQSLKGVLEPFSTQGNIDLMRRAGFVDIATIYKWVCFEGWLAIK